jgi:ATP-dependent Clp protease protease subunit
MKETEFINERLMAILAANCGKTAKQIKKLADRDLWLSAEEAKEFGLIDEIM